MATITAQVVEVPSSLPPQKLFKVFMDFDTIAPKADPQTYKEIKIIEGDGGVGTIKSTTYGDGAPITNSKLKIDSVDTTNFGVTYTIFEGDALLGMMDKATHHLAFIPSVDGGSIYRHIFVLHCKPDVKLTEDQIDLAKQAFTNTFKAIESYAIAHPEVY